MRNHRAFFCEPFGVLFLFFKKRFLDKKREVSIHVSRRLEHVIQSPLHLFPDRKTVRLYHHTATNGGVFCQIGAFDDLVIPLGIIFRSFWKSLAHMKCLATEYTENTEIKQR